MTMPTVLVVDRGTAVPVLSCGETGTPTDGTGTGETLTPPSLLAAQTLSESSSMGLDSDDTETRGVDREEEMGGASTKSSEERVSCGGWLTAITDTLGLVRTEGSERDLFCLGASSSAVTPSSLSFTEDKGPRVTE